MSTSLPTLTPLASAIAQSEGYGVSGAVPTIALNPGDLENGDVGYGVVNAAGGNQITQYATEADGVQALETKIANIISGKSSVYSPDMTLDQFGQTYSGGNPTYGTQLASLLGVPSSTTLAQVQNGSAASSSSSSGILSSLMNLVTGKTTTGSNVYERATIFIIGILLIAAGLFTFRTTQTVIQTGTKAIKNAGEATAL